jgi:hypothetical protein
MLGLELLPIPGKSLSILQNDVVCQNVLKRAITLALARDHRVGINSRSRRRGGGSLLPKLLQQLSETPPSQKNGDRGGGWRSLRSWGSPLGLLLRLASTLQVGSGGQRRQSQIVGTRIVFAEGIPQGCFRLDSAHAPGCLLVNNSLSTTDGDALQEWLAEHRKTFRTKLEERFSAGLESCGMPKDFDPKATALFVTTVAGGLAVEARLGAEREELYTMVNFAMECLNSRLATGHHL